MCERLRSAIHLARCLFAGAVLALQWSSAAAPQTVAGVEQALSDAPPARRSALLLALSDALDSVDTDRALDAAQRARQAALLPHDELLADARISNLQRRRGDFVGAFTTARNALNRATELNDEPARAELLLAFARCNWSIGDYPGAMAAHHELIALAEKLGNRLLVGRGHLGLSVVFGEMKERMKARAAEETALGIAREIGDRELESDALNNLGNNYRNTGDLPRARSAHEQALAIRTEIGNRRGVGDSHINLSEIARTSGEFPTALEHCRRAFAIYEQLGLKRYVANTHLQFASILRAAGRIDEAMVRLRTGFAIAGPLGSPSLLENYQREFAAVAEATGDWRAAYEAERKRAAAHDDVLGERSRQQLAGLNARFEADRRQQEIALLRNERARQEAELRTKQAELHVSEGALERANAMRFALGLSLLSLATALGAIIALQRVRLRAERRVHGETQLARATAEEADRVKTRFLGIASHDIRGPMGNIINLTSELRAGAPRNETHAERCDLIGSEAQRVISLVEDLITTAALESGKLELRLAPLDLAETTRTVVERMRWQADAKRQTIEFPPPAAGIGHITGDAARLHQVIANLLSNAIKFSPPAEKISVTLERNGDMVQLFVQDRGAGIAEKDIARLFAPFERLANHPTAGESSHGLGLSIAQEIVRKHGGTILVESKPGEGAKFIVSLPAAADAR